MLLQLSFSVLCALLALAVASPAPLSPSGPAILLLSHSQRLPLAAKNHLSLYNTRFRRHPVGNTFKALHKKNVSPGALVVNRIHSLDAFRQAYDTVRRAHEIGPRERTMTRPEIAIPEGRLADHHSIQPDSSPEESPATDDAESNGGRGDGLTGSICTNSTECADGRICTNGDIDTCSAGETCICLPSDGLEVCMSGADCSTAGEVCVQLGGGTVCFSEETATASDFPIVGVDTTDDPGSSGGSGDGITGAICTSSSECAGGRSCTDIENIDTCSSGETCICVPSGGLEACTSSADCSTAGEVCVQIGESTVCFSEETANAADIPIAEIESSGTPEETPANEDADSHGGSGDGITGSACTCSSGCTEGRFCTNGNMITCPASDSCICMPLSGVQVCSSSAECLTDGEVCARVISLTLCLSEEVAIAEGIPILDGVSF